MMCCCAEKFFYKSFTSSRKEAMKEEELGRKFPKNLNCVTAVKFKVNQRAMRKRFDFLLGRSRQQSREEAKACGACLEPTELDVLLEEMSEREKLAESTRESCSSKSVETDRKKAEEERCQALERIGETKRRANEE